MAKSTKPTAQPAQPKPAKKLAYTRDRNIVIAGDMIMIGAYPEDEVER